MMIMMMMIIIIIINFKIGYYYLIEILTKPKELRVANVSAF